MKINFECEKCSKEFDCDVGHVTFPEDSLRPKFEKNIICPKCGQRTMDEVFLTELGKMQLTQFGLPDDFESTRYSDANDPEEDDGGYMEEDGFIKRECHTCDLYLPLDDIGLCSECAGKMDRDLIRQRAWAYSTSAFGVPQSKLEDMRKEVIKKFGEKLELIAPDKPAKASRKKTKQKKKKR